MPVDSNIALQVKPFVPGMTPQQAMSLKQLGQTMQMQDMQIQEYHRKRDSENQLRTLFSQPDAIDPESKQPTLQTLQKVMAVDPQTGLKMRGDMITAMEKKAQTDKAIAQTQAALSTVDQRDRKILERHQLEAHNLYESKLAETKDPALATKAAQEYVTSALDQEDKLGILNKKYIQGAQPFNPERSAIMVAAMRPMATDAAYEKAINPPEKMAAPTELKKLMDERDALPAGDQRKKVYEDKIRKLNAPTQTMINLSAPTEKATPERDKQVEYWAEVLKKGGSLPPGLARNRDGAALVKDVMKRVAQGDTTPAELMAGQSEFMGQKAGQRTLGTRTANIEMAVQEAQNVIPIALQASREVDRTKYPTLNKLLLAVEKGTGDEKAVRLATATNALINVYSRAIAPTGQPTVSDKEHAREIISNAYSNGQYAAVVDLMQKEMGAAQKSPRQVKDAMREDFTGKNDRRKQDNDPLGIR